MATVTATYKGKVIAKSDNTRLAEGNHYFPPESVNMEFLSPSGTQTTCHWKGVASYYDLTVDGETRRDAAWYYPETKPAAAEIAGRVAFWRGVEVVP